MASIKFCSTSEFLMWCGGWTFSISCHAACWCH